MSPAMKGLLNVCGRISQPASPSESAWLSTSGQIFAALDAAQVDYVVVGGLALILHGSLRATADLAAGRPRDLEDIDRLGGILAAGEARGE